MQRLRLAGVGCGARTNLYLELASRMPERYEIVGGADPVAWKVDRIARYADNGTFRRFGSADELLSADRFADVLVIGTQDQYHVDPCIAAIKKGYDVLLEKPIAPNVADMIRLESAARNSGRRVLVCHVMRYAPLYEKIKQIVESGQLGEIVSLQASEGVGTFHQAHSFVRGHWGVTEKSSPMIIQKSCHDMDIITWLLNRPCETLSSFGQISYFDRAHCPTGAPAYCTQGCPAGGSCQYNAERYLTDQRWWLDGVFDGGSKATDDKIIRWLGSSPWGRCVFQSDNTAVDHQTVNMRFAGGATATFTMSAFDEGRNLELWGTEAILRAGAFTRQTAGCDIVVKTHRNSRIERLHIENKEGGYASHEGADWGLVSALYDQMRIVQPEQMRSSLAASVQSHLMGFAAERSRLENGRAVEVESMRTL